MTGKRDEYLYVPLRREDIEPLRRFAGTAGIEVMGEIGVDVEQLHRPAAKLWHASSFRFGERGVGTTSRPVPGAPCQESPAARMGCGAESPFPLLCGRGHRDSLPEM